MAFSFRRIIEKVCGGTGPNLRPYARKYFPKNGRNHAKSDDRNRAMILLQRADHVSG